jgi:hypothetical protein
MDLQQRKLNKSEWESIEVPVSENETYILNMIIKGYNNVNIKINKHLSIFTFLKIEYSPKMEDYLYNKYLKDIVNSNIQKYINDLHINVNIPTVDNNVKINSADKIRLENNNHEDMSKIDIYEYVLIEQLEKLLYMKKHNNTIKFYYHYYTLFNLLQNTIEKINGHIKLLCSTVLNHFENEIDIAFMIEYADVFIEKNENLLKYGDIQLYEHQKNIFTVCKNTDPKLILYIAPTGTGKTMTPLGLSEGYKIIFVCAARHVGLALAKSAISVGKKIAFAFGCASADDIRLHYFAAKEYSKNKRTGGIGKVDNSIGSEVEIMICDIKSYLPAMYYMLAFHSNESIILYWDEPTITLDYSNHEFHSIIQKNWKENLIQNIILSSATLPKEYELNETISDFKETYPNGNVYNIVSYDCKKTIPILNKDGFVILPHYLYTEYDDIIKVAKYCQDNLTLLRYFDLKEVAEFITYINKNNFVSSKGRIVRYFETLNDVTMTNIKKYYVNILSNIISGKWSVIYNHFHIIRQPRILENTNVDTKGNRISKTKSIGPGVTTSKNNFSSSNLEGANLTRLSSEQLNMTKPLGTSGVYVTTKDAYTLTDGPTIFISNDIEKIAKFCIQQANIPSIIMEDIMNKIEYNNVLNKKIGVLETDLEYMKDQTEKSIKNNVSGSRNKSTKDIKKFNRDIPEEGNNRNKINSMTNEINMLRSMIKSSSLNDAFVPNKQLHLQKWADNINTKGAFSSDISETIINEIMALDGIEDSWKLLLMMGIGVFINHPNITYTEIMKKMADEQKLYMIIATSDYIYGTNYQFCHGFLSKDLDLTQEKIIQAMGRVGRNNIQQTYTIRFRDDQQVLKLFTNDTEKPEVLNMNKLFNKKTEMKETK